MMPRVGENSSPPAIIKWHCTWMEASIRSRGFWMHSSQRFSRDPVLELFWELRLPEVVAPLASFVVLLSEVKLAKAGEADLVTATFVTTPNGPAMREREKVKNMQCNNTRNIAIECISEKTRRLWHVMVRKTMWDLMAGTNYHTHTLQARFA